MHARIALAAVLLVVPMAGCSRDEDTEEVPPRFQTEHDAILDRLVDDFWSEDGDWEGDMQGDATAFAPRVLYGAEEEQGDGQYAEMAYLTVEHEVGLLQAYLLTHVLTMDAVIGAPGLADGYEATHDETWRALFLGGAAMGYDMMAADPDQFLPYVFDLATVYGSGATMCFRAWEISELEAHKNNGLDLVARADAEAWNEEEGLYEWSMVMDWPQATMIMALVGAWRATGDEAYLARAERVRQTMEEQCWDEERGGWLAAAGAHGKGLSGNNNMAWAPARPVRGHRRSNRPGTRRGHPGLHALGGPVLGRGGPGLPPLVRRHRERARPGRVLLHRVQFPAPGERAALPPPHLAVAVTSS
jgi:hypothetical protein